MSSAAGQSQSPQKPEYGEPSLHPANAPPMTDGKSSSSPRLPDLDLSQSEFDLTKTLESILANPILHNEDPEAETVQKRASNVFKLSQENEKLKAELRAMTERLEAAERKQQELAKRARFKERNDVAS